MPWSLSIGPRELRCVALTGYSPSRKAAGWPSWTTPATAPRPPARFETPRHVCPWLSRLRPSGEDTITVSWDPDAGRSAGAMPLRRLRCRSSVCRRAAGWSGTRTPSSLSVKVGSPQDLLELRAVREAPQTEGQLRGAPQDLEQNALLLGVLEDCSTTGDITLGMAQGELSRKAGGGTGRLRGHAQAPRGHVGQGATSQSRPTPARPRACHVARGGRRGIGRPLPRRCSWVSLSLTPLAPRTLRPLHRRPSSMALVRATLEGLHAGDVDLFRQMAAAPKSSISMVPRPVTAGAA